MNRKHATWVWHSLLLVIATIWLSPITSVAQEKAKAKAAGADDATSAQKMDESRFDVEAKRVNAALDFAKQHMPEIGKLLGRLKETRPEQYRRALYSLVVETERLQALQSRDEARFKLQLALWKNQKASELVLAQITIRGESDKLRERLTSLYVEKRELQLQLLDMELNQVRGRIEQLESSKAQLQGMTGQEILSTVNMRIEAAERMRQSMQRKNADSKPKKDAPGTDKSSDREKNRGGE